jgi:ferredoxin
MMWYVPSILICLLVVHRLNCFCLDRSFVRRRHPVKAFAISINVDGKTIAAEGKSINLRRELMKNNIDVYPLKAKITGNCGGAGICGTCAVKILSGGENLSPPSANEQRVLQENKRGSDIRLSCCTKVNGNVSLRTKP